MIPGEGFWLVVWVPISSFKTVGKFLHYITQFYLEEERGGGSSNRTCCQVWSQGEWSSFEVAAEELKMWCQERNLRHAAMKGSEALYAFLEKVWNCDH